MHGIDDVDAFAWFARISECHQRTRQAVELRDYGEVYDETWGGGITPPAQK